MQQSIHKKIHMIVQQHMQSLHNLHTTKYEAGNKPNAYHFENIHIYIQVFSHKLSKIYSTRVVSQ